MRRPPSVARHGAAIALTLGLLACSTRKPPADADAEPPDRTADLATMQSAPPKPGAAEIRGSFRYMADAAIFIDCRTGHRFPVATEGSFPALEAAYAGAASAPGAPVSVHLGASTEKRTAPDSDQPEATLIVSAVHGVGGDPICATAVLSEQLAVGRWQLAGLNGAGVAPGIDGKKPHLIWAPSAAQVAGGAGCNRFFGEATIEDGSLKPVALASTKRFCADQMAQETAFLSILNDTPAIVIVTDDTEEPITLELRANAGRATFVRAAE